MLPVNAGVTFIIGAKIMSEITVAVVQMEPKLGDVEANIYHMADMVERICTAEDTDLIVFPELATTGVEMGVGFNPRGRACAWASVQCPRHARRRFFHPHRLRHAHQRESRKHFL